MSRCFKALPLTLALVALSMVTASCGSSSNIPAQVRFVNAIPDTAQYGTALDIAVAGMREFTDVPFQGFQPSSGYTKIVSGGAALQGIQTGTTTPVFIADISLNASTQYTLVATGFATSGKVVLISAVDNNLPPPNGQEKFRVINASPSGPAGSSISISSRSDPIPPSPHPRPSLTLPTEVRAHTHPLPIIPILYRASTTRCS